MSKSSNPSSSNSDSIITSIDPFKRLVKLTARAFYDGISTEGDNQAKSVCGDRGIAVVVLEALTRRKWVREVDLAKDLKLHLTQIRTTLELLEKEKLVTRDHLKDGAKPYGFTLADNLSRREGETKVKLHTHSCCCLNYAQIHDVVMYRLQQMRKYLKDELDNMNTDKQFVCPNCGKRYNALDAIAFEDVLYRCESCHTELVAESDIARKRREKLTDLLQKMEVELKPLTDLLSSLKYMEAPDIGTCHASKLRTEEASKWVLELDSIMLSDDEDDMDGKSG